MSKGSYTYRNVSLGIQKLRNFLLGRKHTMHNRFPPFIAPRTIPTPDLPRGPDDGYSKKYYYNRSVKDSVKPPVVAPVAEGPPMHHNPYSKAPAGGIRADSICFNCAPTPGPTWWWDGHDYYDKEVETRRHAPNPQTPSECTPTPPKK